MPQSQKVEVQLIANTLFEKFDVTVSDYCEFHQVSLTQLQKAYRACYKIDLGKVTLTNEEARGLCEVLKIKFEQKIISAQMLKGGVAKTTTALNLGLRAAMMGARVLFIDLDQQANLTFSLGIEDEELPVWIDIFEKKKVISECVRPLDQNIDLIPSSLNNSVLERALMNSNRNWSTAVSGPLSQILHRYDWVIIDTAPALSMLNTAVTLASDVVLLPVNPDRYSWLGLLKNMDELDVISEEFKKKITKKVLFTRFDSREKTSHSIWHWCQERFPKELFQFYIRTSTDVKNTLGSGKTIFSKKSGISQDFDLLTSALLKNEKAKRGLKNAEI